ncbi:hypothetical protein TWF718_001483 [Orbilia javanica]|uniref:Uncharacterized protein n=1 Tax=Orbilia javanica TaxID=47235 RepID=A0AAN8MYZ7_9PEZI
MSDDLDGSAPAALPPNIMREALITSLLGPEQTSAGDGSGGTGGDAGVSSSQKSKKRNKNKQPYIEMNLGLGVLEELKPSTNGDDKEANERRELIDRIYELRRLQEAREENELDEMVITEPEATKKKVIIEELE